jgi:hypothetical protein
MDKHTSAAPLHTLVFNSGASSLKFGLHCTKCGAGMHGAW